MCVSKCEYGVNVVMKRLKLKWPSPPGTVYGKAVVRGIVLNPIRWPPHVSKSRGLYITSH